MKRILIVIHNIVNRAGTQRAVTNLANILAEQGYKVFICSMESNCGEVPFEIDSSVFVKHLNLKMDFNNRLDALNYKIKLLKLIKTMILEDEIHYVIGTNYLINQLLFFLPKGIKTIACEHFSSLIYSKTHMFLRNILWKNLDAVVLLTEQDKKNYKHFNNTYVIPNSMSFIPTKFSDCKAKKIVSLGRFTYQKGFDILIDAIVLLKDKLTGWSIEIYGYGEDKEFLKNKITQNDLDKIIYIKDNTSDVESVYSSASIYLFPSRFEGFGMVLLEAQSCGLPAVSFDCPCGPSDIIVEEKTGFLIPLGDVELFSKRLLELVNNEKLRIEMGKNAIINAKRFSKDRIALMWKTLLEKI